MENIRLLVVDDDLVWLKGLSGYLNKEDNMVVVGMATNMEDALKYVTNFDLDVILMDLNLTGNKYDGILLSQEIQRIKKVKIIILTSFKEKELITDAFAAGAADFFCKDSYELLPYAIRSVYMNNSPVEILAEEYSRLRQENRLKVLTAAEREVFELKKSGLTIPQMANTLHKTSSTLKKQMNQILKKLGISRFDEIKKLKF